MKKLHIQISDTKQITKILNKKNYLILIICLVFLIIDYDLFNPRPRILITNAGVKLVIATLQIVFVISLIFWQFKKKKIKTILANGIITNGKFISTTKIKTRYNKPHVFTYYVHLLEHKVNNEKYQVTLNNIKSTLKSNLIIYQADKPENYIVYEDADLYKELKEYILENIKSLPKNSTSSISILEELTK